MAAITRKSVVIPVGDVELAGDLALPASAMGLVIFAHGSGSSRLSPRNQHVAEVLQQHGLATLLFDLLTVGEERVDEIDARHRFNIPLLTARLLQVTDWARKQAHLGELPIGYFGASTGAAAALLAAVERPGIVRAVVSRGGRPDLALSQLHRLDAPTLMILGELDRQIMPHHQQALDRLRCVKRLAIVPGASHLFEEAGTLDVAAKMARVWFEQYLSPPLEQQMQSV